MAITSTTKKTLSRYTDATTTSALSGKSITAVEAYQHGSTDVIEISFSGGSQFIKYKQGVCEVGGTAEFGTGTTVIA